ncbi:SusC/RagA family TonB-linked outer membrane protein [Mucilaginibacter calamicampi]|uniref:SusC/RagA family TonB-linked outer membrane protein n=1 Tax=Mucilaginibacter calamicampi TaxID=1302352 RepID=A0ABW2YS45_9SPHI
MYKFYLFLLLGLLSASAFAQQVSLSERNSPLSKVFDNISRQTGYDFLIATENLKLARPVTIHVSNEELRGVLDKIFAEQPLRFVLQEKMVVVSKKQLAPRVPARGTVRDTTGTPLGGAAIKVIGTSRGTLADSNGDFMIDADLGDDLEVSFIGYETVLRPVGSAAIRIVLQETNSRLNEIQVIGYGATTKRLNTGSLSAVKAADIEKQPVTNVLSALSGRMAGVFVQTTNGLPGGNVNIQVRGRGSLTAGTQPLFIIDGVPFESNPANYSVLSSSPVSGIISPLNSINPADIEEMTVLKDADATAIYGSRGANGVVLLTTKRGKAGTDRTDLSYTQGISRIANLPKLLSLPDYLAIRREAFANDNVAPTAANAPDLLVWDQNNGSDWARYLFGNTAGYRDLQARFSGGSAATVYTVSANYHGENNIITDLSRYTRGGLQASLRHVSANGRLEVQFSNVLTLDNNKSPNVQNSSSGIYLAPNFRMIDANGAYTLNSGNPLRDLNSTVKSNTGNVISNLVLNFRVNTDIQLKVSAGYNQTGQEQTQLFPLRSVQSGSNYAQFGQNSNRSFIVEPQLNYSKRIDAGLFSVLIGGTYQDRSSKNQFIKGSNYSNETLMENIASATTIDSRLNNRTDYKYLSAFARLTYNLKERYILNITARRDGSSRFGPGNRFGNFGSVGAAWLFSEESWVRSHLPLLSFGKLRASYGTTGNDQITDYQYLSTYSSPSLVYQGISVLRPSRIDNSDFHWETTRKLELALELGFLKDRILLNTNYYINRSGDQLVNYALPSTTGFIAYQANLPAVIQNTGLELELATVNIKAKDFRWTSAFNLTIPRNKLLSFQNFETSSYAENYELGYDISRVRGYRFLGVDPHTGAGLYADKDGRPSTTPYMNYTIGKTSPDLYGGFSNTLTWRALTLDIFFQFAKQMAYGGLRSSPGQTLNNYAFMVTRWQKPGDITSVPKPGTVANTFYLNSSANYFNSSYIRLKNISLAYELRPAWTQKLRLYLRAENILTFWNRNAAMLDPESGGYVVSQPNLPPVRSLVAGLQLTF